MSSGAVVHSAVHAPVHATAEGDYNDYEQASLLNTGVSPKKINSMDQRRAIFYISNRLVCECLAEFFGTFILVMFGTGVVAQTMLSNGKGGQFLSINLAWGLGVMFGISISGGVSGGHLNPAVTLTFAVFKRLPWRKVMPYMCAQVCGAFAAAGIVYCVYADALFLVDDYTKITASIFATYPQSYQTIGCSFFNELVGTALLLSGVFALSDAKNVLVSSSQMPAAVGLLVAAIGMSFGYNTGYALNPARDLGPRLFTSIAGWGHNVFVYDSYYFWVPIMGPFSGGLVGAALYQLLVGLHHPSGEE